MLRLRVSLDSFFFFLLKQNAAGSFSFFQELWLTEARNGLVRPPAEGKTKRNLKPSEVYDCSANSSLVLLPPQFRLLRTSRCRPPRPGPHPQPPPPPPPPSPCPRPGVRPPPPWQALTPGTAGTPSRTAVARPRSLPPSWDCRRRHAASARPPRGGPSTGRRPTPAAPWKDPAPKEPEVGPTSSLTRLAEMIPL